MSLTAAKANASLDFTTGNTATAPTLPLKLALLVELGSDTVAGTEASGGSYARQDIAFPAASDRQTGNNAVITFTNLAADEYVGAEIWDSAATPVRWRHGAFTTTINAAAGDSIEFAVDAVLLKLTAG